MNWYMPCATIPPGYLVNGHAHTAGDMDLVEEMVELWVAPDYIEDLVGVLGHFARDVSASLQKWTTVYVGSPCSSDSC